jgi:hypothetical protein
MDKVLNMIHQREERQDLGVGSNMKELFVVIRKNLQTTRLPVNPKLPLGPEAQQYVLDIVIAYKKVKLTQRNGIQES